MFNIRLTDGLPPTSCVFSIDFNYGYAQPCANMTPKTVTMIHQHLPSRIDYAFLPTTRPSNIPLSGTGLLLVNMSAGCSRIVAFLCCGPAGVACNESVCERATTQLDVQFNLARANIGCVPNTKKTPTSLSKTRVCDDCSIHKQNAKTRLRTVKAGVNWSSNEVLLFLGRDD